MAPPSVVPKVAPERLSAPVKARVPLGRPGGAPKAAEATFAMDPAAPMAPPSVLPKVAPRQQTKKQEPPSVRPKVPALRGPGSAAATVAVSPAARQSMPVGGGFSRLPTMPGSSASTRAALLAPVPESPSARLSSTPVRGDLPPLENAGCPELTPIRRQ
ncbi:uncharacterized protein LOC144157846 [Haemaphysalis longicornis]